MTTTPVVKAALPTGIVTFLFTDVEGSTPLWEEHPEAMRAAVALHHAVLRRVIPAHDGQVFKVIGDAFQAAFALPAHGLYAAIAIQHALGRADWPAAIGPLKVRMGLHVGPAEVEQTATGADYAVSHTLNRAARIMSAGHGGQVLLSREAADLLERDLPHGVLLLDLGEHHLKGLSRPERLAQVCAPGLQPSFPPLAAGSPTLINLPAALTSFIGREPELAALGQILTDDVARLVTLTGPGGTGKTRLALRVAGDILGSFPDGAWFVDLAPLTDPGLVVPTCLSVLGLSSPADRPGTAVLLEHLRSKNALLILDNCEHLVEAAADLAATLLRGCLRLTVLATSRETLGVAGEAVYRVPALALPDAQGRGVADVQGFDAIRLFVARAHVVEFHLPWPVQSAL